MKYRKKPVVVEAIQFNGNSNLADVEAFVGRKLKYEVVSDTAYEAGVGRPMFAVYIPTLEGEMEAMPYDWIIRGVNGEYYPCKPWIFEKTYEEVRE